MKKINAILILSLFVSPTLFANCPAPDTVSYTCNEGHCSWAPRDGWYEGSNPGVYTPTDGAKAAKFVAARWAPYSSPVGGATTCYYADEFGNSITLVQQTEYGEVPRPTQGHWVVDPENPRERLCTTTAETCYFEYGEKY